MGKKVFLHYNSSESNRDYVYLFNDNSSGKKRLDIDFKNQFINFNGERAITPYKVLSYTDHEWGQITADPYIILKDYEWGNTITVDGLYKLATSGMVYLLLVFMYGYNYGTVICMNYNPDRYLQVYRIYNNNWFKYQVNCTDITPTT